MSQGYAKLTMLWLGNALTFFALCKEIHRSSGHWGIHLKKGVVQKFDVYFDFLVDKQLNKQSSANRIDTL